MLSLQTLQTPEWQKLTDTAKLILFVLDIHKGKKERSWPSIDTLCEEVGKCKRQILYGIKELKAADMITVEKRVSQNGKYNAYEIQKGLLYEKSADI